MADNEKADEFTRQRIKIHRVRGIFQYAPKKKKKKKSISLEYSLV